MAKVTINQFRGRQFGGASPFGNLSVLTYALATAANGGAVGADSAAPLAVDDKVVLGTLPAGMRLDDCTLVISTAMSATVTGIALSSAARLRNASSKAIVTLPKTANLVLTIAGAPNAKVSKIDVAVIGELLGPK